ncbi:MAG: hypothetical protein WCS42_28625, partial [Verrucomicrobiota bacterium]
MPVAFVTLLTLWIAPVLRAADQTKADNATALDQAASWVGNAVPGQSDRAIWDGTLSAANSTNSAGASVLNVGQIQVKSPGAGVPIRITGSSAWWRLFGVSGAAIDMSTATADLTIGPGFTVQSWTDGAIFLNQAGRTLTISGQLWLGN